MEDCKLCDEETCLFLFHCFYARFRKMPRSCLYKGTKTIKREEVKKETGNRRGRKGERKERKENGKKGGKEEKEERSKSQNIMVLMFYLSQK